MGRNPPVLVLLGGVLAITVLIGGVLAFRRTGEVAPDARDITVTILSPRDGTVLPGAPAEFQARVDASEETTVEYLLDGQLIPPSVWAVPPSS